MEPDDIVVVSSKVIATAEGSIIDLGLLKPSEESDQLAKLCGRSANFCEAVLMELRRMNGNVIGTCPGALLTEVRPDGLKQGVILTANAGLDESNAAPGHAVGWPKNCVRSASELRRALQSNLNDNLRSVGSVTRAPSKRENNQIAIIISDSCCRPRRWGVTAFALAVSGLQPLASQAGRRDIAGKPLRITVEAVADQLATAANFLMGNAGQMTPACIIRNHGLPLSDNEGWVEGIEPQEDLFKGIMNGKK